MKYSVLYLCSIVDFNSDVSASGYYAYLKRKRARQESSGIVWPLVRSNEMPLLLIRQLHSEYQERYGSPRITAELHQRGVPCTENRVVRLIQNASIFARRKRKFWITTVVPSSQNYPENLLKRKFYVDAPNKAWVSDTTYVPTMEGWLHLATIMDLFSRKLVGWAMRHTLERHLTCQALLQAVQRRNPAPGVILHSDRGFHYRTEYYHDRPEVRLSSERHR
jgi:transposase InsO family protein